MYSQNDRRWCNDKLGTRTIGQIGCLLTSLCNINNLAGREEKHMPDQFNTLFKLNSGYTENLIIWAVAEKILKAEIDPWYKGSVEYDINSYYIVNFLNFGSGHFTNLLSKKDKDFYLYDVWNGKNRIIRNPRRIVKVTYK